MEMRVSISKGNIKMGHIPSVSLPAVITCAKGCKCAKKCYALKIEKLRPVVRAAYKRNLDILNNDPEQYWREVEGAIKLSLFFRFHVSGDIPSTEYFRNMVEIAKRNPHCQILCFTKQYKLVNTELDKIRWLPNNLHLIFSAWEGMEMDNPFNLPEAHVRYKNGTTTARKDAKECSGNCTECATLGEGCWTIKKGEQVVFDEH